MKPVGGVPVVRTLGDQRAAVCARCGANANVSEESSDQNSGRCRRGATDGPKTLRRPRRTETLPDEVLPAHRGLESGTCRWGRSRNRPRRARPVPARAAAKGSHQNPGQSIREPVPVRGRRPRNKRRRLGSESPVAQAKRRPPPSNRRSTTITPTSLATRRTAGNRLRRFAAKIICPRRERCAR